MRSEHLRHVLASALCALLAFALVHAAAEAVARWAERCPGAHLWWKEEQLSILEPALYEERDATRLFVYGASVAREAVHEATIVERLPDFYVRDESHSLASRSDVLRYLEYLEGAHGPEAFPEHLVLTWTPRMLADVGAQGSALGGAIDRYSPGWRRAAVGAPALLEPRGFRDSLGARWRAVLHQRSRYRNAVRTVFRVLRQRPLELDCRRRDFVPPLRRATYRHLPPKSAGRVAEILGGLNEFWRRAHTYDFAADRAAILADLDRIRAFCERHGVALYVVTMPERSGYRALYADGVYEEFLALIDEGFAADPRLHLRTLLEDDEYFDHCHANLRGARKFSRAVAEFVGNALGV